MDEHEFNKYLNDAMIFQGQMTVMANSIELLMDCMLNRVTDDQVQKSKKPATFGAKVNRFQKAKALITDKNDEPFDKLVKKLRALNRNWNITKHGMIVGGKQDLTFFKDSEFHTFTQPEMAEIKSDFTEIMSELTQIWNSRRVG